MAAQGDDPKDLDLKEVQDHIDEARRKAEEDGLLPDPTPEPTYLDPDADGEAEAPGPHPNVG
jgi:hypothetical protein